MPKFIQPALRIHPELNRRLEQSAQKREVSLNAEMNRRLEYSFEQESLRTIETVAAHMQRMISQGGAG
jgi:hypothetical protein